MQFVREWFRQHFNDPQVVSLVIVLLVGLGIFLFFSNMLAPVVASVVLAYLLEGLVQKMERWRVPRLAAVLLVFSFFFAGLLLVFFLLLPLLVAQVSQFLNELPRILSTSQSLLLQLPEKYPQLFSQQQVTELIITLRREALDFSQRLLTSFSVQYVVVIITMLVYLLLLPFLVFFFLKDKARLIRWCAQYLPRNRVLLQQIWTDVDMQIGNYIRGKFLEILIVWVVSYLTFLFLGLAYAMLLSLLVGLSVIIPYIGAAVVTVPIGLIAYFQFGFGDQFLWIMAAYALIQALDGNVLVPVMFSEVVNLHPVAIIVAILIFGGFWGFWGVFFAIPLATFIQAILKALPSNDPDLAPHPQAPADD
ncbi:MAG: AI-2E family transporter [Alteromonadaceae bacterium]|nr:AI-2E family transporter [Alteromonadaceae bacterium]|tara:strand:+ start:3369 stop:4457 length:1089 start_codon:yes stop_codon:yes gene_type:complete